nr:MAG TPA: hypothetical protein [Caudoviricetes sp.]
MCDKRCNRNAVHHTLFSSSLLRLPLLKFCVFKLRHFTTAFHCCVCYLTRCHYIANIRNSQHEMLRLYTFVSLHNKEV